MNFYQGLESSFYEDEMDPINPKIIEHRSSLNSWDHSDYEIQGDDQFANKQQLRKRSHILTRTNSNHNRRQKKSKKANNSNSYSKKKIQSPRMCMSSKHKKPKKRTDRPKRTRSDSSYHTYSKSDDSSVEFLGSVGSLSAGGGRYSDSNSNSISGGALSSGGEGRDEGKGEEGYSTPSLHSLSHKSDQQSDIYHKSHHWKNYPRTPTPSLAKKSHHKKSYKNRKRRVHKHSRDHRNHEKQGRSGSKSHHRRKRELSYSPKSKHRHHNRYEKYEKHRRHKHGKRIRDKQHSHSDDSEDGGYEVKGPPPSHSSAKLPQKRTRMKIKKKSTMSKPLHVIDDENENEYTINNHKSHKYHHQQMSHVITKTKIMRPRTIAYSVSHIQRSYSKKSSSTPLALSMTTSPVLSTSVSKDSGIAVRFEHLSKKSNLRNSQIFSIFKFESLTKEDETFWPYYRLISDISQCDANQLLDSIDQVFGVECLKSMLKKFAIAKLRKSLALGMDDFVYAKPSEMMDAADNNLFRMMRLSIPSFPHPCSLNKTYMEQNNIIIENSTSSDINLTPSAKASSSSIPASPAILSDTSSLICLSKFESPLTLSQHTHSAPNYIPSSDEQKSNRKHNICDIIKYSEISIRIMSCLDQKMLLICHKTCRLFLYASRLPKSRTHLSLRIGRLCERLPINPGVYLKNRITLFLNVQVLHLVVDKPKWDIFKILLTKLLKLRQVDIYLPALQSKYIMPTKIMGNHSCTLKYLEQLKISGPKKLNESTTYPDVSKLLKDMLKKIAMPNLRQLWLIRLLAADDISSIKKFLKAHQSTLETLELELEICEPNSIQMLKSVNDFAKYLQPNQEYPLRSLSIRLIKNAQSILNRFTKLYGIDVYKNMNMIDISSGHVQSSPMRTLDNSPLLIVDEEDSNAQHRSIQLSFGSSGKHSGKDSRLSNSKLSYISQFNQLFNNEAVNQSYVPSPSLSPRSSINIAQSPMLSSLMHLSNPLGFFSNDNITSVEYRNMSVEKMNKNAFANLSKEENEKMEKFCKIIDDSEFKLRTISAQIVQHLSKKILFSRLVYPGNIGKVGWNSLNHKRTLRNLHITVVPMNIIKDLQTLCTECGESVTNFKIIVKGLISYRNGRHSGGHPNRNSFALRSSPHAIDTNVGDRNSSCVIRKAEDDILLALHENMKGLPKLKHMRIVIGTVHEVGFVSIDSFCAFIIEHKNTLSTIELHCCYLTYDVSKIKHNQSTKNGIKLDFYIPNVKAELEELLLGLFLSCKQLKKIRIYHVRAQGRPITIQRLHTGKPHIVGNMDPFIENQFL